jgi:WD40 repeat protein/TolB-like protein
MSSLITCVHARLVRFHRGLAAGLVSIVLLSAVLRAGPALYPGQIIAPGIGRIADLAFSSDGRLLAAGGERGWGVWDAQTGDSIRTESARTSVTRVAFGAHDTLLVIGGIDGRVTAFDLRSGTARETARHNKPITAIAAAPDGRLGASGDSDGNLTLWDPINGPLGPLTDGGHKRDILVLAFAGTSLLSASKDLQVVTWDPSAKRPLRRGTLQSAVRGRVAVPSAAAVDPSGDKLLVGAQLVSEQRGGALVSGGLARPSDLRRENLLTPYTVSSGISTPSIYTADFGPERVAVGPGACFAFFTSFYRDQSRLHVWGLTEAGDDLARLDLQGRAAAIALHPQGSLLAVGSESGEIRTWKVSGATAADCDLYARKSVPATSGPTITLGSETEPLIKGGSAQRIAVLSYEATGVDAGLGGAIAEMVAGQLANNPQLTVIERAAINSILKELEIQRSGLTASDAARIGRGLNARTVLFGSVRRFGESTFVITTRAVDVETQQIQGAREVTCEGCKEQDLPRAVSALRRTIVP